MPIKWRTVQRGQGPTLAIYLCGHIPALDAAICAALPGSPIIATSSSGRETRWGELARGIDEAGAKRADGVIVAGFSAGCQGVRAHLWQGLEPVGVIALDGTHGAWPTPRADQVDVWTQVALEGRRRERLVILTCTQQRYVQRLSSKDGGPYAASSTILARALSLPEWETVKPQPPATYPGTPAIELHEGDLHVLMYPGTDCDHDAHAAQLRHVLPDLLARYVRPYLSGRLVEAPSSPVDASPDGPVTIPPNGAGESLGTAARRGADALVAMGAEPSHGYRCAVAELVADARALGRYHRRGSPYRPKVGDLLISARSGGDPENGGPGHVERVTDTYEHAPLAPLTIGANERNTWVLAEYDLRQPDYRGCIEVTAALGARCVTVALEEHAARVAEVPGSKANPRIQTYHAGARRGGSPLAGMPGHETEGRNILGPQSSDEVAWCASGASWCTYHALVA